MLDAGDGGLKGGQGGGLTSEKASANILSSDSKEDIMKDWPWELIISIIGGGFISALFGWLSAWSTNRQLKITTHILAGLGEGLIKGHQVTVVRNKRGEPIGLNLVVSPVTEKVNVGENVIVVIKKADKTE